MFKMKVIFIKCHTDAILFHHHSHFEISTLLMIESLAGETENEKGTSHNPPAIKTPL
jgi:hypothetical protein